LGSDSRIVPSRTIASSLGEASGFSLIVAVGTAGRTNIRVDQSGQRLDLSPSVRTRADGQCYRRETTTPMVVSCHLSSTLYDVSESFEHVIGVPDPIHDRELPTTSIELDKRGGLGFVEI
jgi:hypothetical protein